MTPKLAGAGLSVPLVMNIGRFAGGVAFVAGAGAAIGSGIVKVPLAVCVRSVQAGAYPNAFAAAKAIVDTAGVRSLFTVSTCLLPHKGMHSDEFSAMFLALSLASHPSSKLWPVLEVQP